MVNPSAETYGITSSAGPKWHRNGREIHLLRHPGVAGSDAAARGRGGAAAARGGGTEVLIGHNVAQLGDLDLRLASTQGGNPRSREQISSSALLERPDDHAELRVGQNTRDRRQAPE